jgi:hypothetical protein
LDQKTIEQWHDHGGWSFAFPPALPAQAHPAIWLASDVPSVITFLDTEGGCDESWMPSILRNLEVLHDRTTDEGRHLVLSDGKRRYRLLVKPTGSTHSGYLVHRDRWVRTRLAAIQAFDRSFPNFSNAKSNDRLLPSPNQKRRLALLLNILDTMHRSDRRVATTRKVAQTVVYQNTDLGRAIEWKSSSSRRQTQRLINEAQFLVEGGYRWLLKGLMRPRSPSL